MAAYRRALPHTALLLALLLTLLPSASTMALADPALPLPRMPICGDQGQAGETITYQCGQFTAVTDVRLYQVPGTGQVDLRYDFVFREATYNNELAVYRVDGADGSVDGILPSAAGYAAAAMRRAAVIFPSGATASTQDVSITAQGGDLLAFLIVQNGSLSQLRSSNPDNLLSRSPLAFFALEAANPDRIDHFVGFSRIDGSFIQFGFEDQTNGGDRDYDDIVYNVSPRLVPLTGTLAVTPIQTSLLLERQHTITVTATSTSGARLPGVAVALTITGPHARTASLTTNTDGTATYTYAGTTEGTDTISVSAQIGATLAASQASVAWITHQPLIFVPGIMGSFLDYEPLPAPLDMLPHPRCNIWLGLPRASCQTLPPKQLLALPSTVVMPTDAIREVVPFTAPYKKILARLTALEPDGGGYVEYDPGLLARITGFYDLSPVTRCERAAVDKGGGKKPTLFVFAYDWRQDSAASAKELGLLIDCVQRIHPGAKVDLLTHSMGGLVARRYILDHPQTHSVDRMVTIAAPWLGAPKALAVMETGWYNPTVNLLFAIGNIEPGLITLKLLAERMPAVHQLLPSRGYVDSLGIPGIVEDGRDLNGDGRIAREGLSYDELTVWLDRHYLLSDPGSNNSRFHTQAQDDWSNPNATGAGVRYTHIFGAWTNKDTPGSVRASWRVACLPGTFRLACVSFAGTDIELTQGDGTVPLASAARCVDFKEGNGCSTSTPPQNLNLPGADLFPVFSDKPKEVEHTALASNDRVLDKVLNALRGRPLAPARAPAAKAATPAYQALIEGADALTVTNAAGDTLDTVQGTLTTPLEGVSYVPAGSQRHLLVLPTGQPYTISWRATATPLAIDLTTMLESTPQAAGRYQDVALPAGAAVALEIPQQGGAILRYDANGDGQVETVVQPTVSLDGSSPVDSAAPAVTIRAVPVAGGRSVSISANDSGTGVRSLYYSLDGTTFQPYSAPLVIDPAQHGSVYTFADDRAANRSDLSIVDLTVAQEQRFFLPLVGTGSPGIPPPPPAPIVWPAPPAGPNITPVGISDWYPGASSATLAVGAPGVLANDYDVDSAQLTVRLGTSPLSGTIELASDGGFRYTPRSATYGTDRFTYLISDGQVSSRPVTVLLEIADTDPPRAPTAPRAAAAGSSRILVSWTDTSANETGFEISDGTQVVAATPAGATSVTITGLSPQTRSCYQVRAVNGSGSSAWSASVCATTLPVFELAGRLTGIGANAVAVQGSYAYVGGDGGIFTVIDISNAAQPRAVGQFTIAASRARYRDIDRVVVSGSYAYIIAEVLGLLIIDISDPTQPREVGQFDAPAISVDLAVRGSTAYVADAVFPGLPSGLSIVDISNPAAPREISRYSYDPRQPMAVALNASTAYVAIDTSLEWLSVANPAAPTLAGSVTLPGSTQAMAIDASRAYLATTAGLRIFNISGAPQEVGALTTLAAEDLTVSDGLVFVAAGPRGLVRVDPSGASPAVRGELDTPGSALGVAVGQASIVIADGDSVAVIRYNR